MKEEIRILRKCQKIANDNVYPGYPLQEVWIIDMENGKVWDASYHSKPISIDKMFQKLNNITAYCSLGSNKATKGNWLIDTKMDSPQSYLDSEYEDFYIDDLKIVKFYFAINSAIRKSRDTKNIIFAIIDEDCEWVDCQVFTNKEDIKKYYEDYFKEQE